MNFNQLLAFYGVARERSFTRAAKSLAISQPAVTRRIQEMELGCVGGLGDSNV
jgi:DNA-binding transcriptional LysR family regulator